MSAQANVLVEGLRCTVGPNPSAERQYAVTGAETELDAWTAIYGVAEAYIDLYRNGSVLLPLAEISVESVGIDRWTGNARYAPYANGLDGSPESTYQFSTSGGTMHLTHSLETITRLPIGTAPDHKGAIGVTGDGNIEGVDWPVPAFAFSEQHRLSDALVTPAYKLLLMELTGKVNSVAFRGWAPGECRFDGATGNKTGTGLWDMTFSFSVMPNGTNIEVGGINVPAKAGWDYLWVQSREAKDATSGRMAQRPIGVYVERLAKRADLNAIIAV